MSESSIIMLLVTTNLCSAGIAFLVTFAYWRDRHFDTLRGIAAERRADAAAIRNARIIENVYGETLGLDIQEGRR